MSQARLGALREQLLETEQALKDKKCAGRPDVGASGTTAPAIAGLSAPDFEARVTDAVAMIVVKKPRGAALGSGFFVTPRLVVTNRHVIR